MYMSDAMSKRIRPGSSAPSPVSKSDPTGKDARWKASPEGINAAWRGARTLLQRR